MNIKKITIGVKPRTKKNHQRNITTKSGRRLCLPSEQFEQFEKECLVLLLPFRFMNIDTEINLKCLFYIEKDYKSDLVGYLQAIQDVLVKAGVLSDDNRKIIVSTDGSRVFVDRENPRIEIEITKLS